MSNIISLLLLLFAVSIQGDVVGNTVTDACNLTEALLKEIRSYQPVADKIIQVVLQGQHRGKTYQELAEFVDMFGARQAGSQNLEDAITFILEKLPTFDLDNVHGENVTIPHWIR